MIERNEMYPRNSDTVNRTAKQHDKLLESFLTYLKDDPILDEKPDDSGILQQVFHFAAKEKLILNENNFGGKIN